MLLIFSRYSEESKMIDGVRELGKVDSDEKNILSFVDCSGGKTIVCVGGCFCKKKNIYIFIIIIFFYLCWAVNKDIQINK